MQDELIGFEVAKLAKEKGFNEECISGYRKKKDLMTIDRSEESYFAGASRKFKNSELESYNKDFHDDWVVIYTAPTQSLLQKWLREVHKIYIEIRNYQEYKKDNYAHTLNFTYDSNYNDDSGNKIGQIISRKYYDYYELALEAGLLDALKLIKTKEC